MATGLILIIFNFQQKQDIFSEFSHNLTLSPHHISKKHYCDTPKSTHEHTPNSTPKTIKKKNGPVKENNLNKEDGAESIKTAKSNTNCVSSSINNTNSTKIICNCCAVSSRDRVHDDLEFLYAFVSVSVQENVLPQSFLKGNCYYISSL